MDNLFEKIADYCVETGSSRTIEGSYYIDAIDIIEAFEEDDVTQEWLNENYEEILYLIDSSEKILSETWVEKDDDGNFESFNMNFCTEDEDEEKENKLTREEVLDKLKDFMDQGNDYNGIMLFIPEEKQLLCVSIGTGDNLLKEDKQNGYDSYLYLTQFEYDGVDMEEIDGGDMMYRSEEETYDKDICTAVYDALKFIYDYVPNFIPLQLYVH